MKKTIAGLTTVAIVATVATAGVGSFFGYKHHDGFKAWVDNTNPWKSSPAHHYVIDGNQNDRTAMIDQRLNQVVELQRTMDGVIWRMQDIENQIAEQELNPVEEVSLVLLRNEYLRLSVSVVTIQSDIRDLFEEIQALLVNVDIQLSNNLALVNQAIGNFVGSVAQLQIDINNLANENQIQDGVIANIQITIGVMNDTINDIQFQLMDFVTQQSLTSRIPIVTYNVGGTRTVNLPMDSFREITGLAGGGSISLETSAGVWVHINSRESFTLRQMFRTNQIVIYRTSGVEVLINTTIHPNENNNFRAVINGEGWVTVGPNWRG